MNLKVLVLEDNNLFYQLLKNKFDRYKKSQFVKFTLAKTWRDGLDKYARDEFDLVLLDLFLPDSSGLNTVKRASKAFDLPIVILSSNDYSNELMFDCIRMGAQDFITKKVINPERMYRRFCFAKIRYENKFASLPIS